MDPSTQHKKAPPKLLAGRVVKIKLALVSAFVLMIGAWLAPRAVETPLSVPQEHAAPLLEEQVQLREVSRPFVGVQEVAAPVREHSVAIVAPPAPVLPVRNDYAEPAGSAQPLAGFGVFIGDSQVLTHSRALSGRTYVDLSIGDGRTLGARVVAYERATGLVLLQVDGATGRPPAALATDAPGPGALAVAVGRSDQRSLAVPAFVTSVDGVEFRLGASHETVLPGMPVFNLSGQLFAIAAPDGTDVRAIPVWQAVDRMLTLAKDGERPSSFGVAFQALAGGLIEPYGAEGVLIADVLPGGPAEVAGIRAGDVLLAVDDQAADSPETVARLFGSSAVGVATTWRIRRVERTESIEVTPAFAYEIAALGRSIVDAPTGPEARALFPATILQAAAIPPTARVISINGRVPASRAQVLRELRLARRAVPVLVREGDQQFFSVVGPTP